MTTTTKLHTCRECAYNNAAYCMRNRMAVKAINYACRNFMTVEDHKAMIERKKEERIRQEEMRLNFILTAMYISATATVQQLEYFDMQFTNKEVESDWRFSRKRAANEIKRCVQRIRDIYQHTFMEDHTKVMTADGTEAFDVKAWDTHEDDGRMWNLLLYHHVDTCWGDEKAEKKALQMYEGMPHLGIFTPRDYSHWGKAYEPQETK